MLPIGFVVIAALVGILGLVYAIINIGSGSGVDTIKLKREHPTSGKSGGVFKSETTIDKARQKRHER